MILTHKKETEMANTILHKRSSTSNSVPTSGQMTLGELALNTTDGRIYMKTPTGIVEVSYRDSRVRAAISTSGWSNLSYDNTTGVISISAPSTTNVTEGTNKYYTDARVKDYLSGGTFNGDIIPATDNVYSLGSASKMWRDVYVGPGSLYVNGQKVLEESSGNIVVSADINQNLVLATTGDGNVELDPQGTGSILLKGPVQVQAGSSVISSDGNAIQFGNQVAVDSITSKSTNTDLTLTAAGTGKVLVNDNMTVANNLIVSGNLTINGTTTTINATTLSVADNIIDLNSNVTGSPTSNAGIRVVRGDESATQLRWNETTDAWQYTADGSAYFDIVGATATQTLTNKTIAANSNTISGLTNANFNGTAGITNANLANSTVTVGSTAINLGSTATSIAGLASVTATTFTGNLVGNVTGTITGGITGNAATATALQNARTINGVSFDGTGNVTVITAGTGVTINGTQISVDTSTTLDKTTAQTLSNKTLASPVITGTATFNGSTSGSIAVQATATAGTNTITLPAVTGTVVTTGDTGSVTNAMLAGSIADSKLSTISTAGKVSNSATTAASANTASAIVARDASGNFTAGTITAALTGNVTGTVSGNAGTVTNGIYSTDTGTVTNTMLAGSIADSKLSTISTAGKVSNSATTATSANTASAIVARDASGNFTAGTITAALTGNVTGNVTGSSGSTTGNAATATTLATARTINGTIFDGSANISFGTGSVAEGANLYFTDARAVSANTSAIATAKSEAISTASADATSKANAAQAAAIAAVTGGAGAAFDTLKEIQDLMATDSELSSAISAISNVPSATRLQTARTIQGVSFDGTAAITVVTAGTGISVSGTTVTNSLSTSGGSIGGGISTPGGSTSMIPFYYANTAAFPSASASHGAIAHSHDTGKMYFAHAGAWNMLANNSDIPTNNNQLTNGAGYYSSGSAPSFGATSTGALSVTGGITATGEITAYYSDANLKTNIQPIANALSKIEAIRGVTFDPNQTALDLGVDNTHQMGVIAQEVEAVAPELVVPSAYAGYKTVKYDKLTALLIEAVKELSAEVKNLKAQLNK
jgi:hypothetical protein